MRLITRPTTAYASPNIVCIFNKFSITVFSGNRDQRHRNLPALIGSQDVNKSFEREKPLLHFPFLDFVLFSVVFFILCFCFILFLFYSLAFSVCRLLFTNLIFIVREHKLFEVQVSGGLHFCLQREA